MAERNLPDDPRHWPEDPFQLLGVEQSASERDLKRAYTQLIRRFKPEHHPEEFRRIRSAYERALEFQKWFGSFPTLSMPQPATPATPSEVAVRDESPHIVESVPTAPREAPSEDSTSGARPKPYDPLEDAWNLAVNGDRVEAYSRLVELDRSRPDSAQVPLRAYWLLAVQPDLDSARSRHDWLATALARSRLKGPAAVLYGRELEADPATGLFGPYSRILDEAASGGDLLSVARQRLNAAGLIRSWVAIHIDLGILSKRVESLEESAWVYFLVAVMAHLSFEKPEPAFSCCSELLGLLQHLELREAWAFDRIEEQQQKALEWNESKVLPSPLREVVRDASVLPDGGWRRAMERAAAWASEKPITALQQCDSAANQSGCLRVIIDFQRLLNECQAEEATAYPPGTIRGLVRVFLVKHSPKEYFRFRGELLKFLIVEAIDPQELVLACKVDSDNNARLLSECVRKDPVLRFVWRTARACDR